MIEQPQGHLSFGSIKFYYLETGSNVPNSRQQNWLIIIFLIVFLIRVSISIRYSMLHNKCG